MLFNKQNNDTKQITIAKIDFETLRLFLSKKVLSDKNLDNLTYENNNLYYKNSLLQNHINKFDITKTLKFIFIDVCIKDNIKICQKIIIKKE